VIAIDTSALLAIIGDEPEAASFAAHIEAQDMTLMSAANLLEAAIVVDRSKNKLKAADFDAAVVTLGITFESVTAEHVAIAREAYRRFGKGNHPARLNFGDCFAYALAKHRNAPLLYKGADFALTDVIAALPPA
jgi:ribonuclease VapC